jgi:ADP-ribose pyrophosphatase
LLFDPQRDELVMVRQFRIGMLDQEPSPWPLELVAGLVDTEESLEEVAIREIHEETGLVATELLPICEYYNSPGASSEKVSLFCARVDASQAGGYHGLRHEHEDIEVLSLDAAEALAALDSGIFNNAMSMIALQWFAMNKQMLVQRWQ